MSSSCCLKLVLLLAKLRHHSWEFSPLFLHFAVAVAAGGLPWTDRSPPQPHAHIGVGICVTAREEPPCIALAEKTHGMVLCFKSPSLVGKDDIFSNCVPSGSDCCTVFFLRQEIANLLRSFAAQQSPPSCPTRRPSLCM